MEQIPSRPNAQYVKARALVRLMKELEQGENCEQTYSEEEAARFLGIPIWAWH